MLVVWILVGIVVLIVVLSLVTSTDFSYAKTVEINAPKATVWKHVVSLKASEAWNPWFKKDPEAVRRYEGADGAVGSQYFWESDHPRVGHGRQQIKAIDPMKRIESEIEFIKPRRGVSQGWLDLEGEDGAVRVTWGFGNKMPRPFNLMLLVFNFEKAVDKDFSSGLNDLKALCEARQDS